MKTKHYIIILCITIFTYICCSWLAKSYDPMNWPSDIISSFMEIPLMVFGIIAIIKYLEGYE